MKRFGVILGIVVVASAATAGQSTTHKQAAKPATDAKASAKDKDKPAAQAEAETDATGSAAEPPLPPHITGPKLVDLGNNTEIELPAGAILFERTEAQQMMREGGGSVDNVVALIGKTDASWYITVEYDDVGFVNDSDANELDPKDLLEQYRQGTEQQNQQRKAMGKPELVLEGWSEMPKYQQPTHQLVWGLKGHSTDGQFVNFFTRILGRNGYLSVDLIDAPERIEQSKVDAKGALDATRFRQGFRYQDHDAGDKSSGMGLKALVLGGAGIAVLKVAKAGVIIKLLLIFKKGFIVIAAAIGGFFKWLFGRKKHDAGAPPTDVAPPSDPPPNA